MMEEMAMKQKEKTTVGRREFLRVLGAGAGAAAATAAPLASTAVAAESDQEKKKARYQPNSKEVQTFYRVNRYPS
jgi:H+/Cl- antiporter ClcA